MKAPLSMKSFVQSVYLLMNAFGSALGIALAPTSADPKAVWMYAGLTVASFCTGCIFFILFRGLNDKEDDMNALEQYGDKAVKVSEVTRSASMAQQKTSIEKD